MQLKRRDFLAAGALAAGGVLLTSRLSFARAATGKSRFVFVILRGALDGLAAVPPYGDRDYAGLRRDLALHAPGSPGGALPLDKFFGLHPSLSFLGESFAARELVVFHAIASPYRERSHFDGQDVLENGFVRPHAVQTGWLNRALAAAPAVSEKELAVALGQNVPLVMRGPAAVTSWSPSKLAALDDETLERITDLYARDPLLSTRLADALNADAIAGETTMADATARRRPEAKGAARVVEVADTQADPAQAQRTQGNEMRTQGNETQPAEANEASPLARREKTDAGRGARYAEVVRAAAGFLQRDDGPRVAVFDTTGWDTHANEGGAEGQLAGRLAALDAGLRSLKDGLGPVWKDTAVMLVTEFGRTAAINGTRGTDHGTGTVAFLVGGAVQGGRVITDWPGLGWRALYQGRDLRPTLDLRSVLKGLLEEHLLIPARAVESSVFPDSSGAKPLSGLVRT